VTITVVNEKTPQGKTENSDSKTKAYLKQLVSANNAPNVGLCIVGVIGIVTAVCTLRRIERQTAVGEKQIILQFRPKIVVRGGIVDKDKMKCFITNTGGTPASITVCKLKIILLGSGQDLSGLMDGGNVIPAGTTFAAGETKILSLAIDPDIVQIIAEIDQIYKDIPGGESTRIIQCVGSIQYCDDLGIKRLTGIYRRYRPRGGNFQPSDNSDLEYAD
jgi:hypothetical protein